MAKANAKPRAQAPSSVAQAGEDEVTGAKQFTVDRARFIGGVLRPAGSTFSLSDTDIPEKLPEGMTRVGELTPAQKAAATKEANRIAEENKRHAEELAASGANNSPDFMGGGVTGDANVGGEGAEGAGSDGKVTTV